MIPAAAAAGRRVGERKGARRYGDRAQLVDRQADQARSDFAAIECELEFVKAQLARLPTRKDLARLTLLAMTSGAALTTILALIVLR
jgi:hypothetical protein